MESQPNLTITEMLARLDAMYKRQTELERQMILLKQEYEQLRDDIDMAETIIMHQSNKEARKTELQSLFKF